jgi:hypothetical protein
MGHDPTVLFCVGAAKAGTSWVHRHLQGHSECHLRSIKELHYFDTVETGNFDWQIKGLRQRLETSLADAGLTTAQRARRIRDTEDWIVVLSQRRADPDAYMAYLCRNRRDRKLVADMTPAYGLLPVARLGEMSDIAANTRFLYIIRDPLSRLWSHLRMLARRHDLIDRDVARLVQAALDRVVAGHEVDVINRGDYAETIVRLRTAVDPQRLLIMFQEELMSLPGLSRLAAFLGISARQNVTFDARVNQGVPLEMPAAFRERALAYLAPQYEFVAREVGPLPQGWALSTTGGLT